VPGGPSSSSITLWRREQQIDPEQLQIVVFANLDDVDTGIRRFDPVGGGGKGGIGAAGFVRHHQVERLDGQIGSRAVGFWLSGQHAQTGQAATSGDSTGAHDHSDRAWKRGETEDVMQRIDHE